MKKNIIRIFIAAFVAFAAPTAMHAQLGQLLNTVKEAMGNNSTTNTLTDAVVNLLGSIIDNPIPHMQSLTAHSAKTASPVAFSLDFNSGF